MELMKVIAKDVLEMKINGKSFFGRNIVIGKNSIVIDGNKTLDNTPVINVEILGSCDSISTMSGDVIVNEAAKSISTQSGDVECGAVYGNVTTMSGDVKCGDISGSVKTISGDIRCKSKG